MADESAEQALYEFRGAYGRYLSLAARLLHAGTTRDAILQASKYRLEELPDFAALYDARQKMNRVLGRIKDRSDVLEGDILEAARQAKHTVEEEWGVTIPLVGGN